MPRPRREKLRKEIAEEIKAVAREQMRHLGTAGLSLRAIAREMDITAPAIYNYFPNLDALITALIVDAFDALAEAMRAAAEEAAGDSPGDKIRASILAYRSWALENPVQFQLIYGNPIPGYEAPAEVTAPLARRPFEDLFSLFSEAWQLGELQLPGASRGMPAPVAEHITAWKSELGFPGPGGLFYLLAVGWSRIHGMVMLELFGHSQPVVGDTAAFYEHEVDALLSEAGLITDIKVNS